MENLSGYKASLEEMQKVFGYQLDSVSASKETNKNFFGAASLIITLLGSLQLLLGKVSNAWTSTYQLLLLISLVIYILFILISIYIFLPTVLQAPIRADWSELKESFFCREEKDILVHQLSQYLIAIDDNKKALKKLDRFTKIGGALLIVLILLFAVLALMPKI